MSATDELRRLLDERGVDYEGETDEDGWAFTRWHGFDDTGWRALSDELCGLLDLRGCHLFTPEQAIAATLGGGTCMNMEETDAEWFSCSECNIELRVHEPFSAFSIHYCPNCGRRVEVDG